MNMGALMKLFVVLIFAVVFTPGKSIAESDPSIESFLSDIKEKKKSLYVSEKAKVLEASKNPEVIIHFFWASWCEYCDKAHVELTQIRDDKRIQGKIQIVGYSLDDTLTPAVNAKLKEMPDLNHFYVSRKKLSMPKEISRLPLSIVEDMKSKDIEVFTGFTRERFRYMKKHILRVLSEQSGDINAE